MAKGGTPGGFCFCPVSKTVQEMVGKAAVYKLVGEHNLLHIATGTQCSQAGTCKDHWMAFKSVLQFSATATQTALQYSRLVTEAR